MKAIQYRAYGGYQENRVVDVDQMSKCLKVVQPTTKFADSLFNVLPSFRADFPKPETPVDFQ